MYPKMLEATITRTETHKLNELQVLEKKYSMSMCQPQEKRLQ